LPSQREENAAKRRQFTSADDTDVESEDEMGGTERVSTGSEDPMKPARIR